MKSSVNEILILVEILLNLIRSIGTDIDILRF